MTQRTRILADTAPPRTTIALSNIVNATGIAKLAGVGRSAVSNWMRRHDDFPKPLDLPNVGGHHALYDLAEIRAWIEEQGEDLTQ